MDEMDFYPKMLRRMDDLIYSNQQLAEAIRRSSSEKDSCQFTEDECYMIYEWASRNYYFKSKHNQEVQDSIFDKFSKLLEKYEEDK